MLVTESSYKDILLGTWTAEDCAYDKWSMDAKGNFSAEYPTDDGVYKWSGNYYFKNKKYIKGNLEKGTQVQLAQLNIAKPKYDLDAPEIAEFVNNLDPINAIAESSEGFVWRLQDDSGDATDIVVEGHPDIIVNMSVWENVESLKSFMFKTHHIDFLKRKKEWFKPIKQASYVLWWVPNGHIPTVQEAFEKLDYLRAHGESSQAFSFKSNVKHPLE